MFTADHSNVVVRQHLTIMLFAVNQQDFRCNFAKQQLNELSITFFKRTNYITSLRVCHCLWKYVNIGFPYGNERKGDFSRRFPAEGGWGYLAPPNKKRVQRCSHRKIKKVIITPFLSILIIKTVLNSLFCQIFQM